MEIKVGQWVRSNNYIYQVEEIRNFSNKKQTVGTCKGSPIQSVSTDIDEIESFADDPRELIQVGDCIRYNIIIGTNQVETKSLLCEIDCVAKYQIVSGGFVILKEYVAEIWTKTNEDTYTCQWRAE